MFLEFENSVSEESNPKWTTIAKTPIGQFLIDEYPNGSRICSFFVLLKWLSMEGGNIE